MSGTYKEILNSDDAAFGGSGTVHNKPVRTHKKPQHGFEQSITVTLPPMSTLYFEVPTKRTRKAAEDSADKPAKKDRQKGHRQGRRQAGKKDPHHQGPRPPKRRMKNRKKQKRPLPSPRQNPRPQRTSRKKKTAAKAKTAGKSKA